MPPSLPLSSTLSYPVFFFFLRRFIFRAVSNYLNARNTLKTLLPHYCLRVTFNGPHKLPNEIGCTFLWRVYCLVRIRPWRARQPCLLSVLVLSFFFFWLVNLLLELGLATFCLPAFHFSNKSFVSLYSSRCPKREFLQVKRFILFIWRLHALPTHKRN